MLGVCRAFNASRRCLPVSSYSASELTLSIAIGFRSSSARWSAKAPNVSVFQKYLLWEEIVDEVLKLRQAHTHEKLCLAFDHLEGGSVALIFVHLVDCVHDPFDLVSIGIKFVWGITFLQVWPFPPRRDWIATSSLLQPLEAPGACC